MILRRVIEHVKEQNWTAVALDFFIVVVGVFIGIQVANWNEARGDRALGEDYVQRLTADLERDFVATSDILNYYQAVRDSIVEADRLLSTDDGDARQLVIAAYRASEFASTPPNRATWDQIVSSGHLGLLPDGAVGSDLSEYYTFDESNAVTISRVEGSSYRQAVRSIIPLDVQIAIREGCSDVLNDFLVIAGFTNECRLQVDPSVLTATAEKLRSDPEIRDELRYQYSRVASVINNSTGNVVLIERVLASLGGSEEKS